MDSLKLSARQGCNSNARQIRTMADWDIPVALAMERDDQWVASTGLSSRVLTITSSTWRSVIVRAGPGRGSSNSPSRRSSTNRLRHLPTVAELTFNSAATCLFIFSLAQPRTIRARNANAWAVFRRLTSRSNVSRSSSVRTSGAFGRPRSAMRTSIVSHGRTRPPNPEFPFPRKNLRTRDSGH